MREKVQNNFSDGNIKIIVSTIAFGMGVDQTVRCVIVFGSPSSIEEYWQQIGRAGRDNLQTETILFFQYKSLQIAKSFLKQIENPQIRQNKENNLNVIKDYFYLKTCRRKFILEHFDQLPHFFCCDNCDNCCEQSVKDVTSVVWSYAFGTEMPHKKNIEMIKHNLLQLKLININRGKVVLINGLARWQKYINLKKIKLENISDKLKVMIPWTIYETTSTETLSEFDKCEKLYKKSFKK
jgi:superfamily II DNA helicase RecQ